MDESFIGDGAVPVTQADGDMNHTTRYDDGTRLPLKLHPSPTQFYVENLFACVPMPLGVPSGRVVEPVDPDPVRGGAHDDRRPRHSRRHVRGHCLLMSCR